MNSQIPIESYRSHFLGVETKVPLLDGSSRIYVNLDNAASTPSLKAVQETIEKFLPFYSSVHRGTGYKSQVSTHLYEQSRRVVLNFFGANDNEHTCIFVKNTTEAINKLAHRYPFTKERFVVLTSGLEHHSNDLPWRGVAHTVHIELTPDGRLNENDFDRKLEQYANHIALVAISGASNVTGYILPIHNLAEKAHSVGAEIFIDCAQLAPHRKVIMRHPNDPSHLDYIAISAHKMYAPFGTGALIGLRNIFEQGDPDLRGGGTVEIVTLDDVVWAKAPERDEAGSPNTIGAIALAAAIHQLELFGMDKVAEHEAQLTRYALEKFKKIPGLQIYGDGQPDNSPNRLGVIPFQLEKIDHFKTSAILGYEFGIGVRSGCFCAHPYILHLLGLNRDESNLVRTQMLSGDKSKMPGLIRASFGLYNDQADVDALIDALLQIRSGSYRGDYVQDISSGEYKPRGWMPDFTSNLPGNSNPLSLL